MVPLQNGLALHSQAKQVDIWAGLQLGEGLFGAGEPLAHPLLLAAGQLVAAHYQDPLFPGHHLTRLRVSPVPLDTDLEALTHRWVIRGGPG
jgi:hypothetical protein